MTDDALANVGAAIKAEIAPERQEDTKQKILAVATDLIALRGPTLVTIRDLAAASGTNIAAINYHFGSKNELVKAVLYSIIEPINRQRMLLLNRFEKECAPQSVDVTHIMEALLRPVVEAKTAADGGSLYIRALQHLRAYPADAENFYVFSTFDEVAQYFLDALQKVIPELTRAEIIWRYELVRGAAMHMLGNCDPISGKFRHLSRGVGMIDLDDKEVVLKELIDFSVAGFSAPVSWKQSDLRA